MRTAGSGNFGRHPFECLSKIEHHLNEAADAVIDTDEPARWALEATANGQRFTSVLAVVNSLSRNRRGPRRLEVVWTLLSDDNSGQSALAEFRGVIRRWSLRGMSFTIASNDSSLCSSLAARLRPRLRRIGPGITRLRLLTSNGPVFVQASSMVVLAEPAESAQANTSLATDLTMTSRPQTAAWKQTDELVPTT